MSHPDAEMTERSFLTPMLLRNEVNGGLARLFSKYLTRDMTVYDVGCGEKPFGPLLKDKVKAHIGVDVADGFYDASHIDLVGSAYAVPVPDGAADAVISSQVLEHLEYPRQALAEAARILKPGGILFLSFPFMYPLHAAPRDYFRYTEFGATALLKEAGFELAAIERVAGFWFCAGFFTKIYLQGFDRGILKKLYVTRLLTTLLQYIFLGFHKLEGFILRRAKKDVAHHRATWTVNYILVAKKPAA